MACTGFTIIQMRVTSFQLLILLYLRLTLMYIYSFFLPKVPLENLWLIVREKVRTISDSRELLKYLTGWRGNFLLSAAEQWLKHELTKNFKVIRDLELLPQITGQDWSSVFLQRFDGAVTCVILS